MIALISGFIAGLGHVFSGPDHLAAVAFNVLALIHYEETGRADLDDMPRYDAPKAA